MSSAVSERNLAPPDLYDVIASAGNNEMKAMLIPAMDPNTAYSVSPLHRLFMGLQGDDPMWETGAYLPFDYCATFTSVGHIAEETVGDNGARAYKINERGSNVVPLLGHLLELSLKEKPSLLAFAGPANTRSKNGTRPNQRRIEIMRLVSQNGDTAVRGTEIADALELSPSHAGGICDDLAAVDIISVQSSGRGKPSLTYSATPAFANIKLREDVGGKMLFDVVAELKRQYVERPDARLSNGDIADGLIRQGVSELPRIQLVKEVAKITNRLANIRGVLAAHKQVAADRARSVVWATPEQRRLIGRYLTVINGAQEPDDEYIIGGLRLADSIISQPRLVNYLVAKAMRNSLGLKTLPDARRKISESISSILSGTPIPLTRRQIQGILLTTGENYDLNTVSSHLDTLVALGRAATSESTAGLAYAATQTL